MVFDDDGDLWRVEARRGHGPHGEVDDAPTARQIALVLGERPMWWSPEKDAGTKHAGQSGQGLSGAKRNAGCSSTLHLPHALVVPHPEAVSRV